MMDSRAPYAIVGIVVIASVAGAAYLVLGDDDGGNDFVDDMISTGGTIIAASQALKEAGAAGVSVACTHGVFASNALERFAGSTLDSLLCCNTLTNAVSHISVAHLIADAIRDAQAGKW